MARRIAGPQLLTKALLLTCALGLAACPVQDAHVPLPPTLDGSHVTTSRASFFLTGDAEPGARIVITRVPLFSAREQPGAVYADPSDARFGVEVPLVPRSENVFYVSAMDSAGIGSKASELDVDQVAPSPSRVTLALADDHPAIAADGQATLRARATLELSDGASPEGQPVVFHVAGYAPAPPDITAKADARGRAVISFDELTRVGAGTLTATVPDGSISSDPLPFEVLAGQAVNAALVLDANPPAGQVSGSAITVPEDLDVTATVVAKDGAGNLVQPGWSLSVVPEALVAGGVVRFESPGSYTVTARVDGAPQNPPLTATATVTVSPSGESLPSTLSVSMPGPATSGVPLPYRLAVADELGDRIDAPVPTVSLSDSRGTFSTASSTVTFVTAGWQTATFQVTLGSQRLTAKASVFVRPGPVSALALELAGIAAPLSGPRITQPGEVDAVTWSAQDAAGNAVPDTPVVLSADSPVSVFGSSLTAPDAPGTYAVVAQVPATRVEAVAAMTVQPQPPASLSLSCPLQAVAGEPILCHPTITDANGLPVAGTVGYKFEPPGGAGAVGSDLILTVAGTVVVTATVSGSSVSASTAVTVRPAPAAELKLSIWPGAVSVGQTAEARTVVADAFGNPLPVATEISTGAPGAIVGGGLLSNLTSSGLFQVFAVTPPGVPALSATGYLRVTAGPARSVVLDVSPLDTAAGEPMTVSATALDASGNPTADRPAITVDGRAPDDIHATLAGAALTLFDPGPHLVAATTGDAAASQIVLVHPAADLTPPEVSVALDAASYAPGSTVTVTVTARDDRALQGARVHVSGTALSLPFDQIVAAPMPPSPELSSSASFTLPASAVGQLTVEASAVDTSGNSADALPVTATVP